MHAHLFNAADVPVRGFLKNVYLKRLPGKVVVARLAQFLASRARSAAEDCARLEEIIGSEAVPEEFVAARSPRGSRLRMVGETLRSRIDMAYRLDRLCSDPVDPEEDRLPIDVYVPLGVDFEQAVGDPSSQRVVDQFDVIERLAQAAIQGELGGYDATILPMVGFDPQRRDDDPVNGLARVQKRVETGRAVGVKLYPGMGFFPIGNSPEIDGRLSEFYTWCENDDVPIVAHCSPANTIDDNQEFAHPDGWWRVLEDHPKLRISLAHAGGMRPGEWFHEASRLVNERPNVWCDIGNHDFRRLELIERVIERCDSAPQLKQRLMFGTDYWFSLMHDGADQFVSGYARRISKGLGPDVYRRFTGCSAREFLGFDDPNNANRQRVVGWATSELGGTAWPSSFQRLLEPDAPCPGATGDRPQP